MANRPRFVRKYVHKFTIDPGVAGLPIDPGAIWMQRVSAVYPKCIWLNPEREQLAAYRQSIQIMKKLINNRIYPTTLKGLERSMRTLAKQAKRGALIH